MTGREPNPPLLAALLLSGALLALLSKSFSSAAIASAVILASLIMPRITVDKIGQIILGLFPVFCAVMLEMVLPDKPPFIEPTLIGPLSRTASLGFLGIAAVRLFIKNPVGKDPVTAGWGFLAVLSMGAAQEGSTYPILSILILLLLIVGAGYRDTVQREARIKEGRRRWTTLTVTGTAAAISALLIAALPVLYAAMFGLIESAYADACTGFGFGMALHDLDGMQQSDEVVMRIRGRRPDYLRGAVYTRYIGGRWLEPAADTARPASFSGKAPRSADETEIRFVGQKRDRFFVPLFATLRAASPDHATWTKTGILAAFREQETESVRFEINQGKRVDNSVADAESLLVPDSIDAVIRDIASSWTSGTTDELSALKAVERRLKRDFDYSLDIKVPSGKDPVVSFLTDVKKGNCEYFASAMALLARTKGIAARVIGGYRVHEYNPIGEYYIVREKNAHAWVEAYVRGSGWTTFDPTPEAEEAESPDNNITSAVTALFDTAADRIRSIGTFLSRLTAVHFAAAVCGLLLTWMAIRVLRALRKRRVASALRQKGYSDPLPWVLRLLEVLAKAGQLRKPSEPLERFATRLRDAKSLGSTGPVAADLLMRYADWRYGNRGDPHRIEQDIETAVKATTSNRPRSDECRRF